MLIGQQIGPFEIEAELGSGAMGTVYRARFRKDEDRVLTVALKMIALGLIGNEGAMARFDREANILKQLKHPHIVKLHATGHLRKNPFIAMEFIDGEPLDRALARRGRLGGEEAVGYVRQLCDALQYAHDMGIIHRDLKPSNLMITKDGTLKLTDFGIAKDTDVTALTGMNSTIGTAAYMSPEQCKGDKNLTNRSDLYSLGIVMFELLTGRKPFTADTTVDMFLKHVNERPPRIDKLVQELPPKLAGLIFQLLEKDKEDRPTDAAWVGRMLAEIEEDGLNRKSAGLDAATTRRADRTRPVPGGIDEADREAARLLKGEKKKKKKKKAVPLFQQKWVQATFLVAALLGLAGVAYFGFIKAPSADKLIARIDDAKSPEARLAAAEAYLKEYGSRPGDPTDKAAAVFREETVKKREVQLKNRHGNKRWRNDPEENDDPKAYGAAMDAIDHELAGRLDDAAANWTGVRDRFPKEAKLPYTLDEEELRRARWGWLGEKRLRDIADAKATRDRLVREIAAIRDYEKPVKFDPSDPESLAIKALRLDDFKDKEKAGRVWEALGTFAEKDAALRAWFLLAAQQRANIKKETPEAAAEARRKLVDAELATAEVFLQQYKADANLKKARLDARRKCREVIDLYDDDEKGRDQLTAPVERAKQLLASAG